MNFYEIVNWFNLKCVAGHIRNTVSWPVFLFSIGGRCSNELAAVEIKPRFAARTASLIITFTMLFRCVALFAYAILMNCVALPQRQKALNASQHCNRGHETWITQSSTEPFRCHDDNEPSLNIHANTIEQSERDESQRGKKHPDESGGRYLKLKEYEDS